MLSVVASPLATIRLKASSSATSHCTVSVASRSGVARVQSITRSAMGSPLATPWSKLTLGRSSSSSLLPQAASVRVEATVREPAALRRKRRREMRLAMFGGRARNAVVWSAHSLGHNGDSAMNGPLGAVALAPAGRPGQLDLRQGKKVGPPPTLPGMEIRTTPIGLVAPAGSLAALKAALNAGADAVYLGLKNATNARNFAGLNFTENDIRAGVDQAHAMGRQVLFAINTFPQAGHSQEWRAAVDAAYALQADAVIMADPGLLAYARDRYPELRLHLSVQGSATHVDAIEFMREQFGISRVILPRVLTMAEIGKICAQTTVEIEVFGFGSLCVMAEGRCLLSSYATGDSPNNKGVCSPAHAVRWIDTDGHMDARLNGILIDRYAP